MTSYNWIW